MDWKNVGKKIAEVGAPLLGFAIGGPGGATLANSVAASLGLGDSKPDTIAKALTVDPEAAVKLQELQNRHKEKLEEISFQRYQVEQEADTAQQAEINRTMRVEYKNDGWFKTGWRPFFGWVAGLGFGGLLLGLVVSLFKNPENAGETVASATVVLSLMLTVLGININKRSSDKQAAIPTRPVGLLEALAKRISK